MIACATLDDKENEILSETDEENENDIHNNNNQHQCFVEEQNQRSGYNQEGGFGDECSQEEGRVEESLSEARPSTSPFSPSLRSSTIEESPATDRKHLCQVNKISEFAINHSPTVICVIDEGLSTSFNNKPENDKELRSRSDDDEDEDEEVEEEEEEDEEHGPALVIAKSLDEADEEQIDSYKCKTHLDPDEYNPDSEYLSDPDFHDERPAKIFNKTGRTQADSCQESEELACSSSGLSKTLQELGQSNSDYIEDKEEEEEHFLDEESFDVEYCIKLPKKESHQDIKQVYEITELRGDSQDSGESVAKEEEEEEEGGEEEKDLEEEGEESESCSEVVSVEGSSDRESFVSEGGEEESDRELSQKDHSSDSLEEEEYKPIVQVRHSIEEVSRGHTEREFTGCCISPYLVDNNDGEEQGIEDVGPTETVSFSFVTEADTEYGISTLESSEIKPVISSRVAELRRLSSSTQDNELSSSECQVTASEARPELYAEESTLAEELTSIQDDEQESQSSCMLVDSLTPQNDDGDDYDELNATGSEGGSRLVGTVIDEMTGSAATLMQINQETVGCQSIQQQESLDDIESEVLDLQPELGEVKNQSTTDSSCSSNNTNHKKILVNRHLDDTEKKTKMLIDLVSDYCDKLVEQIKDEAFKQIDLITLKKQNIYQLNLAHTFEVSSEQFNETIDETGTRENSKKIYTSSLYYNDNQDSFPTIEQQVEQCRTIARQLEGEGFPQGQLKNIDSQQDSQKNDYQTTNDVLIRKKSENINKSKQASLMFKRRRDRMNRFTFEGSSENADNDGCDNENDGQKQTRTRRASLEPSILFSTTNQDERLSFNKANVTQYLESVRSDTEETALTDTEYEAPRVRRRATPARATTTPFRELRRTSRHVEMEMKDNIKRDEDTYPVVGSDVNIAAEKRYESSQAQIDDGKDRSNQLSKVKFKPFLDSTTLKDIERLRHWSPYGAFNEHNSVSPEECLKLVQDLRSSSSVDVASTSSVAVSYKQRKESLIEIDNADNNNIALSKGARMFERRQLQSSDWIVCGNDDDGDSTPTSKDDEKRKSKLNSSLIDQLPINLSQQGVEIEKTVSRPSLSEELLMVADESGEQMVELVPLVMSHAQPKLETATITKIPSFSASSWRVIECESPDLLTSHDGDDFNQDTTPHSEFCDDKTEDQIEDEEISVGYSNRGTSADVSASSDLAAAAVAAAIPAAIQEAPIFREELAADIDSIPGQTLNIENDYYYDDVGNKRLDFNGYCGATVMRVRPQSRSNELHHATTIEWRPQVTTPARLSTVLETSVGGSASFQTEYKLTDSSNDYSIVTLKQHLPTTMDNYYTNYLSPASSTGNYSTRARSTSLTRGNLMINQDELSERRRLSSCSRATIKERGSGVASLRSSYQNLINESANCKYRSYHYPFEDKQRVLSSRLADGQNKWRKQQQQQQRSRCSSLSRYDEADYNVARRWIPPTYEDQAASHSTFINNARHPQVFCSQPPIHTPSSSNRREGYSSDERATTSSSNLQTYHNQRYCQCCCHGSYTPLSDNNSHLTQEESHTGHAPFRLNPGKYKVKINRVRFSTKKKESERGRHKRKR